MSGGHHKINLKIVRAVVTRGKMSPGGDVRGAVSAYQLVYYWFKMPNSERLLCMKYEIVSSE